MPAPDDLRAGKGLCRCAVAPLGRCSNEYTLRAARFLLRCSEIPKPVKRVPALPGSPANPQRTAQSCGIRAKGALFAAKARPTRQLPAGARFPACHGWKKSGRAEAQGFPSGQGSVPVFATLPAPENTRPSSPKVPLEMRKTGRGKRGCFPRPAVVFLWDCVGNRPAKAQFARRASTAACRRRSVSSRPSMAARSVPPPGVRLLPDRAMPSG